MKNFSKGLICGILIGSVICSAPVIAGNIDAVLNQLRINIDGVDEIQWEEDLKLANGKTTPSSILYNGTTYLPMRKIGELLDQEISWNGDSKTVSVTGMRNSKETIIEKPDNNGNVWEYYTFKSGSKTFLGVKDETRGYERIYCLASSSMRITDDEIYFLKRTETHAQKYMPSGATIVKLSFNNDVNTQDGEIIKNLWPAADSAFDGDYVCYYGRNDGSNNRHSKLTMYNYLTRESDVLVMSNQWEYIISWELTKSTDKGVIVEYTVQSSSSENGHIMYYYYDVVFDKTTNTFGEPALLRTEQGELI